MKITDLTHLIENNMPVFPGTDGPVIENVCTMEKYGFREAKISMYSHTGTHIDAPAHMLSDGQFLDNLNIEHFIGKATILDISKNNIKQINEIFINQYREKIGNVDFLILKTGWSSFWGEARYFEDFPSLTIEAAKALSFYNLKGIGIDAISIDDIKSTTFDVHKILLKNDIIIIENLTNLDSIESEYFTLNVLPLKNKDCDGSPVRAVGIE